MPTALVSRLNLDLLHPLLVEQLLNLLAACQARGAYYYAITGYRSPAEQMRLWTQGRTAPGPKVTNARAWESLHNFGLAVDCCRDADPIITQTRLNLKNRIGQVVTAMQGLAPTEAPQDRAGAPDQLPNLSCPDPRGP